MTVSPTQRTLFGGAITIDLPLTLIDAAELRQVPDNQEVLLDPASDRTWILEVIAQPEDNEVDELLKERGLEGSQEEAAVRFHFASLAHDNDATSQNISHIWNGSDSASSTSDSSPPTPIPHLVLGEQHISKFATASRATSPSEAARTTDRVHVYVALFRIPAKRVDLVLSQNVPFGNLEKSEAQSGTPVGDEDLRRDRDEFGRIAGSLRIRDWGLFA